MQHALQVRVRASYYLILDRFVLCGQPMSTRPSPTSTYFFIQNFSAYGLATVYALLAGDGSINGRRILSADYTAKLKKSIQKAPYLRETWPSGFRKFRHVGRKGVTAFGFNGISSCTGFADPTTGTSVAIMVNQVSPKPVAASELIREISEEMKQGGMVWPGF